MVYNCETGIALSSNEDSIVYGNTIHDIENEAILSYYWTLHGEGHSRNKWYKNIIYNAGFGIYESKKEGISSYHEFSHNLFYNIGIHGSYRVPFCFQGPMGIKFYNNTIYMNDDHDALQFFEGADKGLFHFVNIIRKALLNYYLPDVSNYRSIKAIIFTKKIDI